MELIPLDAMQTDRLLGAGCTLGSADLKVRMREWGQLRDRSTGIRDIEAGVVIGLAEDEHLDRVADLAAREAECCPFYTFLLRIDGDRRELEVTAGIGREIAARVLLGLA